ncbi:hypothetical protein B5M09_008680 [Aphanomyces astaci]|uniref:Uncharacterized protein n=1 Tax=Aphanomyces astaci TaxID=112090 RepID=A0A425DF04_APHAT|nr:hypothetical protein B5M09_008680 [Aphanomyces astaci]
MGTGTSCEEVPPSAQSGRDAVAAALTDDNYSVEDGVHSTSNAVLYAHKFTQRHPLLQWNDTENVVHGMGTRSSKLLVLVDICDMSGEVSSRVVLSVMSSSSSLLLSTAHPSGYKLKALLVSVRHPCLLPVLDVDKQHGGHGIFIMAQPFVPTGSIKDLIYCNPVPAKGYASKYSRVGRGLPRTLISRHFLFEMAVGRELNAVVPRTDGGKEKAVLPTSRGAKKPPPLKRMSYRRASSSVMA